MKKILLFTAALAIMASCVKENAIETVSEGGYTIHASIADDTKTSYTEEGVFGWKTNDVARVVVYRATGDHDANHYDFKAQSDGASVDFKSSGSPDWTAWPKSGFALYPALSHGGYEGALTVTLPESYTVSGTDFTAIGIPMIGTESSDDDWSFKAAVGVLKVQLTNVPVAARKLVITDASNNLAGTWPLDATAAANGLSMTAASSGSDAVTVNFPQQAAGSTIEVYVPIPVGTLAIGTTFDVQQSDGTSIKLLTTTKEIPVVRKKIQPINGISVEDWVSLGTGKFIDNHCFYQADNWSDSDITSNTYVDVEIQQHNTETNRYRVVMPYKAMFDTYGATHFSGATGPYDYLTFTLRNDLGTGIVLNDSFRTGIKHYTYDYELWYDNPYWLGYAVYHNNRVIAYDGEGKPTNIQLAPIYKGALTEDTSQNPKIEIVFPGATPMLQGVFNYPNSSSASYSDGTVTATVGTNATAVKVKAAESINAGVAALMEGTYDLEFSTSGNQDLTGLADGTYYLVYKVETDGHGYTFKNGGTFEINSLTEIPLTSEMISVNIDDYYTSTNHAWGAGKEALVDNDIATFWHTAGWAAGTYAAYGELNSYDDLDPTYGAYIDIDLGISKTVTNFQYRACLRNANSDFPKHILIYTSADASVWTKVAEVENICAGIAKGAWINPINCTSAAARYIRFSIIENTSGKDLRDPSAAGCTHLAEIKIFE